MTPICLDESAKANSVVTNTPLMNNARHLTPVLTKLCDIGLVFWVCVAPSVVAAGVGTWTAIGPSVDTNIVVDTVTNDLYASGSIQGALLRSGDFGATWTGVPPPPVADCQFFISALGNGALFALGEFPNGGPYNAANCQESHYKSTDRGASWTLLPPWPLLDVTTFDPTNPSILYGM